MARRKFNREGVALVSAVHPSDDSEFESLDGQEPSNDSLEVAESLTKTIRKVKKAKSSKAKKTKKAGARKNAANNKTYELKGSFTIGTDGKLKKQSKSISKVVKARDGSYTVTFTIKPKK